MTTKKTPVKAPKEPNKTESAKKATRVSKKAKPSQNAIQEVLEASKDSIITELKRQLVDAYELLEEERQSFKLEANYYKEMWTASEQDLWELEGESWWSFTKRRFKSWIQGFKEIDPS